jgi:hypothetical protein
MDPRSVKVDKATGEKVAARRIFLTQAQMFQQSICCTVECQNIVGDIHVPVEIDPLGTNGIVVR